jgi:hypothetical protein
MRYLTFKANKLSDREKFVVLQLDEMHALPSSSYKGGKITGVASNSKTEQANSVQAFLISSIAGSMREIVSLIPVKQLSSDNLVELVRKVISIVQKCVFIVTVVISDNNQLNAKAFETICSGSEMTFGIPNPDFPEYKLFFMFDTVHILKSVRNNWLNQKDSEQTFVYPKPCPKHVTHVPGESDHNNSDVMTTEQIVPNALPVCESYTTVPPVAQCMS